MVKTKPKKTTFDAVLDVFAWISFAIAVILAVTVLLSTFSGTQNGKSVFGYKLLIVESDSMSKSPLSENEEVFFSVGDLIIIKEVEDASTIEVGDVITFVSYNPDSKGKTVTHKVRSIKTSSSGVLLGFETYGINTGVSDLAIVDPSTVIGKYVGKSTFLGQLFKFFKTPAGYFTSILTPCVLLIIFFSIKVGKLIAKKEMLDKYDAEFISLKDKITELENRGVQVNMQTENKPTIETSVTETKPAQEAVATETQSQVTQQAQNTTPVTQNVVSAQPMAQQVQQVQQVQPMAQQAQPPIQIADNSKALEIMAKALSDTISSLTKTIDTLALAVGKPVDTLARTIETLTAVTSKPTVVEKIIENPVSQPTVENAALPIEEVKEIQEELDDKKKDDEQPTVENAVVENAVLPIEEIKEEVKVDNQEDIIETNYEQPILEAEPDQPFLEEIAMADFEEPTAASIFDTFKKFNNREKIPFNKKLLSLSSEIKEFFSEVHNQFISYKKVNYRISAKGITYRVGRKALAKIVVRGKTLKLHLALNVEDYPKTVFFQEYTGDVKAYEEVPFTVKIKSERGKNNAIKLVNSLAEKHSLNKNEQFKKENVIKELRSIK